MEDSAAQQRKLTVYGAEDCCLCDDAKVLLDPLCSELSLPVDYIDITGDPALEAAHRTELPVGYLDGRKVFKYHVDEALLRRRVAGGEPAA